MTDAERFHEHLDNCAQCRNSPFALCPRGGALLRLAVTAGSKVFELFRGERTHGG